MSFWKERNVFITGGTGFLGGWLVQELLRRGAHVVSLVREEVAPAPHAQADRTAGITRVVGTIEDSSVLERTLAEYEIDSVFHLAAQAIVGIANQSPVSTFETNIRGTWTVLEACRCSQRVSRVVVASSDKAYGTHARLPYDEDCALQGRYPYDVSKSCADLIAGTYHHTYGTPVCILRSSNLFGPGDLNFSRIVPSTIRCMLRGEPPVIRSDGSPVRDYVYVEDIAGGYLRLAERMDAADLHGLAFNLGSGEPLSVLELTRAILRAGEREDLEPTILNQAPGEVHHHYMSSERAERLLDWRPSAPLESRLGQSIAWYRVALGVG